jgi:hypothetical protein
MHSPGIEEKRQSQDYHRFSSKVSEATDSKAAFGRTVNALGENAPPLLTHCSSDDFILTFSNQPLCGLTVTAQNSLADFSSTPLQHSKTVENRSESAVLPIKYEQLRPTLTKRPLLDTPSFSSHTVKGDNQEAGPLQIFEPLRENTSPMIKSENKQLREIRSKTMGQLDTLYDNYEDTDAFHLKAANAHLTIAKTLQTSGFYSEAVKHLIIAAGIRTNHSGSLAARNTQEINVTKFIFKNEKIIANSNRTLTITPEMERLVNKIKKEASIRLAYGQVKLIMQFAEEGKERAKGNAIIHLRKSIATLKRAPITFSDDEKELKKLYSEVQTIEQSPHFR